MSKVIVTLNGSPVAGASISAVDASGFNPAGYSSQSTTDNTGTGSITDPTIFSEPIGSNVLISAKYVDAAGNIYVGTGTVTAVANWNPATGFEGWSPNPLKIQLTQTYNSTLLNTVNTQQAQVSAPPNNPVAQLSQSVSKALGIGLDTLIYLVVGIVSLFLFVYLVVPKLENPRTGNAKESASKAASKAGRKKKPAMEDDADNDD